MAQLFLLYALVSSLIIACMAQGNPLFLSQYLPGNAKQARELSQVKIPVYSFTSNSGFITVDNATSSNMFFWLFRSEKQQPNAPLLIWLQGGPGVSSMYALFSENGPVYLDPQSRLHINPYRWTQDFNVLYIDNPIGVGFSFTESNKGYVTSENDVAHNMYEFLQQFYQVFPDLVPSPLYVTGESYAGKYVPSVAYYIHEQNLQVPKEKIRINLAGISVGDGLMDPMSQFVGFADIAYHFSVADEMERQVIAGYEKEFLSLLLSEDHRGAFDVIDKLINGDFYPYPTYFYNITGTSNYYNIQTPVYPLNPYPAFLNLPSTRSAIHVGSLAYKDYNKTVEEYLLDDWMRSVKHRVAGLLDADYKVLLYNGQDDIILSGPQCENFLYRALEWKGHKKFIESAKQIWKVDSQDAQVAGYVKHSDNIWQIIVRNAGHLVPQDQPRVAYDMITRYVNNIPYTQ